MKNIKIILTSLIILIQEAIFSNAPDRKFIYNIYDYDTIINLQVNETTEYFMDFKENTEAWANLPTRMHVSINGSSPEHDNDFPIFITATQQKEISSYQLPFVVQTSPTSVAKYTDMARTLCPFDPYTNVTSSIPSVQVTTASPKNISFAIKLRREKDFYLELNKEINVTVQLGAPKYFFFSFDHTPWDSYPPKVQAKYNYTIPKNVIVIIESDDQTCATISIQKSSCPVFDNEQDVMYGGYHFSMNTKGGITLSDTTFPRGFFIVLLVKESDSSCTGGLQSGQRSKTFRLRVIPTISYEEYFTGALALLGIVVLITVPAIILLAVAKMQTRPNVLRVNIIEEEVPIIDNEARNVVSGEGVEQEECNIREQPLMMSDLCRENHAVHHERSHRYFWSVLTVAIVYSLPVVQLMAAYQNMMFQTGDHDVCYYNFLCAHPLGYLEDVNHVYSNIGYVVLGLVFMYITWRRLKAAKLRPDNVGVRLHGGLQYSCGLALCMEGVLSAMYHFCPNKLNFQFDSSFMYLLGILGVVNMHVLRRPDKAPHAHRTALVLAAAIAAGLFGILFPSLEYWLVVTIIHVVLCFIVTIDIYYVGAVNVDWYIFPTAYRAIRAHGRKALVPDHCARATLLTLAVLANLAIAAHGMYEHSYDFARHLLTIILANVLLYFFSYLILKCVHHERVLAHTWCFLALAVGLWAVAIMWFDDSRTKWSEPPAQSRSHNAVCQFLHLYDNHDLWHVASAAAVFFSLLTMTTADDALQHTPHTMIHVF